LSAELGIYQVALVVILVFVMDTAERTLIMVVAQEQETITALLV
jgi:hypothetical protein